MNRCKVAAESSWLTCSHLCSHVSWYNTIEFLLPFGCSGKISTENTERKLKAYGKKDHPPRAVLQPSHLQATTSGRGLPLWTSDKQALLKAAKRCVGEGRTATLVALEPHMIAVFLPAVGIEPTSRYQRTFLRRKRYTSRLPKYLSNSISTSVAEWYKASVVRRFFGTTTWVRHKYGHICVGLFLTHFPIPVPTSGFFFLSHTNS